jgi:hypothetical protein
MHDPRCAHRRADPSDIQRNEQPREACAHSPKPYRDGRLSVIRSGKQPEAGRHPGCRAHPLARSALLCSVLLCSACPTMADGAPSNDTPLLPVSVPNGSRYRPISISPPIHMTVLRQATGNARSPKVTSARLRSGIVGSLGTGRVFPSRYSIPPPELVTPVCRSTRKFGGGRIRSSRGQPHTPSGTFRHIVLRGPPLAAKPTLWRSRPERSDRACASGPADSPHAKETALVKRPTTGQADTPGPEFVEASGTELSFARDQTIMIAGPAEPESIAEWLRSGDQPCHLGEPA